MTAEQARALFSCAYDGELDAEPQRAFDAALAADAALARDYAEFRSLLQRAGGTLGEAEPLTGPSPDLLAGVQSRLRARSRGRFYGDKFAERAGGGAASPLRVVVIMLALVAVAWLAYGYLQGIELLR